MSVAPLPRALAAEAIGTFALVFAGAGAVMVDAKTHAPRNWAPRYCLVDLFLELSAGFWLCERVRRPGDVEVVLTLCNA
jgi:glycerol uptake facilitator-like aquaporin